jgi:L-2,4-diaminobutyrate transaminase
VEFVKDRATKENFASECRIAARLHAEIMKNGVVTRTRPATGNHPATGDILLFAPPLVVTEAEVDQLVSASRDAAKTVFGI